MDRQFIEEELSKIAGILKKLRSIAQGYKTSFIILVGGAITLVMIRDVFPLMVAAGYPMYIILLTFAAFFTAILLPMAYMPLNKFLKDATLSNLNYGLKHTIVLKQLSQYNCNLEYRPFHGFDENLLFRKNIIDKGSKGAVSDDLIAGTFNNHNVKLAEYHVGTFLKRSYDGYVAIVFDNQLPEFEFFNTKHIKNRGNKNVPEAIRAMGLQYDCLAFITNEKSSFSIEENKSNTLLIGVVGNKTMLEYNFSKVEKNPEIYLSDLISLNQTLQIIDELTKISSPIKLPHTFQ